MVGLTADQRLICFNERRPQKARDIGYVAGMSGDTRLVGIDFRVQDGMLYGVGDAGGVYQLDTTYATATLVNRLTVPLTGTSFGVDFNPAADRLRIVSDTGQNLRHDVNAGGTTIQDDPLDYPVPTQLNSVGPTALGVTGSAYTNNDLSPDTATTLYALDTNLDQVAIQSPPNDGTLAATGKLGVDAQAQSGFDIYSQLRDGVTVGAAAFASLTLERRQHGLLQGYVVDRQSGAAQTLWSARPGDRHRSPARPALTAGRVPTPTPPCRVRSALSGYRGTCSRGSDRAPAHGRSPGIRGAGSLATGPRTVQFLDTITRPYSRPGEGQ